MSQEAINLNVKVDYFEVYDKLNKIPQKTSSVLRSAVNKTARDARKLLSDKARQVYDTKKIKVAEMKLIRASKDNLTAHLKVDGNKRKLVEFRTRFTKKTTKARVLRSGSMTAIKEDNRWAFRQGNNVMMRRIGEERYPVTLFSGLAVAQMIGSKERVYGELEPKVQELLLKNIEAAITKFLDKEG